MSPVFLDASFAIALSAPPDQHHERALEISRELDKNRRGMVTTRAVVLEIGNALARQRYRKSAINLLQAIEEDPLIEIVPITNELYQKGFALYSERRDKEWSITDCLSFVVMREMNLTEALTTDRHFVQAGFMAILLES